MCYDTSVYYDASAVHFPGQLKEEDHGLSDDDIYNTLPLRTPNLTTFGKIVPLYCVSGIPDREFSAEKLGNC
jgi:hypothetical protein